MLINANLPISFWNFTVKTAAYITNRTAVGPIINGKRIILYKTFTNKRPNIDYMRIWGSKCVVYILEKL